MEKSAENVIIRKYMHIERTSEGRKRFVTKMPCDKNTINDTLKGSNRAAVIRSTRMKLKRLSDSQRKKLWTEFTKLCNLTYITEIEQLSDQNKKILNDAVATYYIPIAPAYKNSSQSTSTRCAFDASAVKSDTKKSLNSILPIGFTGVSLTATFRNFRIHLRRREKIL